MTQAQLAEKWPRADGGTGVSVNYVSDTALIISRSDVARAYVDHARQAFPASEALTTRAMVEGLEVVR